MGSCEVDLLGDGHHAHLARPKSLEQSDLLSSITSEAIHPDNDNGIGTGAPGLQQMGDPTATRSLAQELRTADTLISDDFNQLCPLGQTPGPDPALLGV
jgi:hypothetical protein